MVLHVSLACPPLVCLPVLGASAALECSFSRKADIEVEGREPFNDAAVQMEGRAAARSKGSGDRDLRGPERSSHRSAIEGTAISSVVAKVVQALKIADDLKLSRASHQSDLPSFPPCFRARKGFQKDMAYLFLGPYTDLCLLALHNYTGCSLAAHSHGINHISFCRFLFL